MADTHSRPFSLRLATAAIGLGLTIAATAADVGFRLRSASVAPNSMLSNDQVYSGFGCSGKNISPALRWKGAPHDTKSFALTVYDPDAPTGSGWWHWVVYNIPADVTELPEGAGNAGGKLPAGAVQGHTDFGTSGFGGACPPAGDKPHRYIFTVYALKTEKISVPDEASAAMIGFMIHANALTKATLTAHYGR
jgi:Raf kinase inhibitor-like YbhB/YbcL family protein